MYPPLKGPECYFRNVYYCYRFFFILLNHYSLTIVHYQIDISHAVTVLIAVT